jgi:hypothetical protein
MRCRCRKPRRWVPQPIAIGYRNRLRVLPHHCGGVPQHVAPEPLSITWRSRPGPHHAVPRCRCRQHQAGPASEQQHRLLLAPLLSVQLSGYRKHSYGATGSAGGGLTCGLCQTEQGDVGFSKKADTARWDPNLLEDEQEIRRISVVLRSQRGPMPTTHVPPESEMTIRRLRAWYHAARSLILGVRWSSSSSSSLRATTRVTRM